MRAAFKKLIRQYKQVYKKAFKKGPWKRFTVSFLILSQLGVFALAAGGTSPLADLRAPGSSGESTVVTARDPVGGLPEDTRDSALEAVLFQDLLQVSETTFDQAVLYAWAQIPLPAGQSRVGEGPQNLAARCQQKIMEQIQEQNPTAVSNITDSYLMETKQGELLKISTKNLGAVSSDYPGSPSFYLLVEASQITSAERAVFLRQLVTRALKATLTGDLSDRLEPQSIVTDGINSGGIKSDVLKLDGIRPDGIEAFPVKSSLNLTLSRSGRLTSVEQLRVVKRMLTTAGAGSIQGLSSSELISLTAYTPRLAGHETLAGELVNLQIASRYHSLDNRTYFQIGAPLLMIEY